MGQVLFTFCKQSSTGQVVALHAKELLWIFLYGITWCVSVHMQAREQGLFSVVEPIRTSLVCMPCGLKSKTQGQVLKLYDKMCGVY